MSEIPCLKRLAIQSSSIHMQIFQPLHTETRMLADRKERRFRAFYCFLCPRRCGPVQLLNRALASLGMPSIWLLQLENLVSSGD